MGLLLALTAIRTVGEIAANLLAPPAPAPPAFVPRPVAPRGPFANPSRFQDLLGAASAGRRESAPGALRFAEEVSQELAQRGVRLTPAQMERLMAAADELAARGGERGLVLMDGMAYAVDLRQRLVTQVMEKDRLGGQAYVNFDSVIEAKT